MKMTAKQMTALLLLPMLAAGCGGGEATPSDTTIAPDTSAEETDMYSNVPTADYKGYTFTVLNSAFDWCLYQMGAEEMSGEIYNDAVFQRNTALEERLNIKFEVHEEDINSVAMEKLEALVLANDDVYDAAYISVLNASPKASAGYYLDLYSIDSLHLSEPWWNQRSIPSYELKGKLYWAHGYGQIQYFDCLWTLYFNRSLIDDLKLDDPYQMVLDGTWTLDIFNNMMTTAAQDLDGNGTLNESDRFGMTCINGVSLAMLHSAGESAISLKDGVPVISTLDDKLADTFEKIQNTLSTSHIRMRDDDFKEGLFLNGQSLFYGETLGHAADLRNMNADFGIIPYPKYDDNRAEYGSYMSPSAMGVYIPTTVADPERSGTVIECLNALSYETVLPIYYDLVLGEKHLRDEYSKEVIDIMFESAESELAYVYRWNNYHQTVMNMMIQGLAIASTLESERAATEAAIAEFMEQLG